MPIMLQIIHPLFMICPIFHVSGVTVAVMSALVAVVEALIPYVHYMHAYVCTCACTHVHTVAKL
jgi:hypothetical protein